MEKDTFFKYIHLISLSIQNEYISYHISWSGFHSPIFIQTIVFFFKLQVVGDNHNTLIFNMSESTSAPLNDCQPQLSFFVCMAGDDSLREYYKHCINEVFR